MKRIATLTTALAITGSFLLAPAASADPSVSVTSNGVPVQPGGVGQYNQDINIDIDGCLTPQGDPAYIGYFLDWVSPAGDPEQFEAQTGAGGGMHLTATIGLREVDQQMSLNWYCSTTPVTSATDPAILWLSPEFTQTIAAGDLNGGAAAPKVTGKASPTSGVRPGAKTVTAKAATATGAVSMTIDPDALPLVDKMGINGASAARIKAQVDAKVKPSDLERLIAWLLGRKPAEPTSAQYVTAAFQVTDGKAPSAKVMKPYVDRLDKGQLRVAVVEDIALSVKSASYWNKR